MKIFKKNWPILFIFFLWFAFCSPFFLHRKTPYPSTYQVSSFSPWDAYGLAGPIKNQAMPDVITQIYPWKYFTIQTLKSGQIPFWNPYSFSGTPHLANYQSAVLSPFNLLFFAFPFITAWGLLVLLQPLLAGLFMLLYLRGLKISQQGSVIGSISFMFSGFLTVWMGYATLGYAVLFLPLGLFTIEKSFQSKNILYQILLAICMPLSFFSGHFQISLYILLFLIAYIIYKGIVTKQWIQISFLLLFTFFGVLLTLPQILPTLEFYQQSIRSTIFQKVEVIPWGYLPSLIAPDFFGNPVTRNDWFGHYAEWNGYIGVISLFFAMYSMKNIRKNIVVFYFISGALSILFAFPSPLLNILVSLHIPVLSTSAVSRVIVLYSFSFCVLAAYGFDMFIESIKINKYRSISIWLALYSLIFILLWAIVTFKIFLPIDKVFIAKQNLLLSTGLFGLFIVIVFLSRFIQIKRKIVIAILTLAIILLVSFDMFRFATKWQTFDNKTLVYSPVGVTKQFPQISDGQKIIMNSGAENSMYYNLPSFEGYDSLFIQRYGEFMTSLIDGKIHAPLRNVAELARNGRYTPLSVNLLDAKYIVHKKGDDFVPWTFPVWTYSGSQFPIIYQDSAYRIYKNLDAYPHAFLANKYEIITDSQNIVDKLFSKSFDTRNTLILEKKLSIQIDSTSTGSAKIIYATSNGLKILVNVRGNSLLFLSDPYYLGWKATIDGKTTEIYRADYAFRAISVSSGKHIIIFSYFPNSFLYGLYTAVSAIIAILILSICKLRLRK